MLCGVCSDCHHPPQTCQVLHVPFPATDGRTLSLGHFFPSSPNQTRRCQVSNSTSLRALNTSALLPSHDTSSLPLPVLSTNTSSLPFAFSLVLLLSLLFLSFFCLAQSPRRHQVTPSPSLHLGALASKFQPPYSASDQPSCLACARLFLFTLLVITYYQGGLLSLYTYRYSRVL